MTDQRDRRLRILLSILFFPIGLILALAGVRTRIIAWCFAGFYIWILTVVVVVAIVAPGPETSPGDSAQTEPIPSSTRVPDETATTAPTITPIVRSCPTPEEALYFSTVGENASERRIYMNQISRLSLRAGGDPSLLIDDVWKLEIGVALGLLTESAKEMESLNPPDSVRFIHQDWVSAGGYHRNAAMLYAQGIDELNTNKVNAANDHLTTAAEFIASATQKVETFCR